MKIEELEISGCFLISLPYFKDERGSFVKTFNSEALEGSALEGFDLQEEFYSTSKRNVLRGLHFQKPPAAHSKLVTCTDGAVIDFFVDLRKSSSTYGKSVSVELSSETPQLLYLPKGIAHGFLTMSDSATLLYKTDFVYSPEHDDGILWSSIDLTLPSTDEQYTVSERDKNFISLTHYESPFE
ncbi:dTDP-4-dehydrorhamnose 3,5-epimerase family protein [Enterovibrio norvegicus]|uniref:dTDP-4-dehydrorhamnose 3,5-epimerase family protein n=1 Tax=Enterovibrio norvegicus TaxID=188144 RepID=UPI000C8217E5|nr:dTDP-4-dehydrorhamnose 3,5-epimerase family protein [Enterovibrio norvegicus]PMH72473.1 hypothetical protein BCU62_02340 [Enterovibrio norvegicus]